MKNFISLMRPWQWAKNLFLFAPLFFSGRFLETNLFIAACVAFFAYCLAASAIYCFNDIHDCESDRLHPRKRSRPVASGKISVCSAYALALGLMLCSAWVLLYFSGTQRWMLCGCIFFYLLLNVGYCIYLKRKTLIDVFIIAFGFVLRLLTGSVATGISLSHWLLLMTFLLALFLALAKRRDDVVIYEDTGVRMRHNIERYNLSFMNQSIAVVAAVNVVCYILYCVSPEVTERVGNNYLYFTSLFVLLGMLRYMQLTTVDVCSGSPTYVLMHDRFIQCCILGWGILFAVILYL